MNHGTSRRGFLGGLACAGLGVWAASAARAEEPPAFPRIDLHVHLDNSTVDAVVALGAERNVKLGIVEHAGSKENKYPVVISNDAELAEYVAKLDGKPVFKGLQAEWLDWADGFSPEALAKLDFVLCDAMTMPDKNGLRTKLWEEGAEIGEAQAFMDRYVDWHVQVLESTVTDFMANVSWLPASLTADYDSLWTDARVTKIVEAAVKRDVALEISSGMELPREPFLRIARDAGARFTFGTNGRYPKMGLIDYSLRMAEKLGLTEKQIFVPAPGGARAGRRNLS